MKTENDHAQNETHPDAVSGDYQNDCDEARSYLDIGLFDDALGTMEKWRGQGRPGTMQLILQALLPMKQYERAAEEGLRMRADGVGYDPDGAFELAVALNACGRHHEAREIWLEADKMDERPVFLVGLACELTYLERTHAALRLYCLALQQGFRPGLYDLGDPDMSAMWEYAAANEIAANETGVLSSPFWDPFIQAALAHEGLPNQGHATVGALEPSEREILEWDSLKATFVISAEARKNSPELADAVYRKLRRRFEENIANVRLAVTRARERLLVRQVYFAEMECSRGNLLAARLHLTLYLCAFPGELENLIANPKLEAALPFLRTVELIEKAVPGAFARLEAYIRSHDGGRAGQPRSEVEELAELCESLPECWYREHRRSGLASALGDDEACIAYFESAVAMEHPDPALEIGLAYVLGGLGQVEKAKAVIGNWPPDARRYRWALDVEAWVTERNCAGPHPEVCRGFYGLPNHAAPLVEMGAQASDSKQPAAADL